MACAFAHAKELGDHGPILLTWFSFGNHVFFDAHKFYDTVCFSRSSVISDHRCLRSVDLLGYMSSLLVWIGVLAPEFVAKGPRLTLGVWGWSRVCDSLSVRNRCQPFAAVRSRSQNRPQPPATDRNRPQPTAPFA